ncbi:response regulator [Seohaeicola zhoushanensis]|uniref:Response regulator n=1 Tax=Seohaeicola zhoushanensis TaxID=1569283 RepID=A0A8J3GUR5_9RHOB|nr:response regulator [Seohaeicola zhoushanensis]GHF36335.1 response regulator [Seohaeicola zhoushanensis]
MELKRILHADDDPDIREIVQMSLDFFGDFELLQFPDGASAFEAFQDFKPQLLLLDYMMPGMTGPELWQNIAKVEGYDRIPAIFLTAKAEASVSEVLMLKGAAAVILKPFTPDTLVKEIQSIWESWNAKR